MFNTSLRARRLDVASRNRGPSPVDSTFSVSQIVPDTFRKPAISAFEDSTFDPPPELPSMSSAHGSVSPDRVFDSPEQHPDHYTDPTNRTSESEHAKYDLKPPPPSVSHTNIEVLGERFFSLDHLNLIIRDPSLHPPFSKFLRQFKPASFATLTKYIDAQKAVVAFEYANAVAAQLQPPMQAAVMGEDFEEHTRTIIGELLSDALPSFLTHQLVRLVCETLVREITQTNAPIMREMIPSLAEVYCVTDPSTPDNPIVYASEEFYKTTQYGKEYVIGKNCRFLQGPKTSMPTVQRLIDALAAGQEITETILNYRRDGTPFMNLLMIAPLYDNKGTVRYFLGCQIDVSSLIEGGRGMESFSQLLAQDRTESRYGGKPERNPVQLLSELGSLLDENEIGSMRRQSTSHRSDTGRSTPQAPSRGGRRVLGMDEPEHLWPNPSLGPSGRLPGVYQNYLLVRPYPSLRITFTSPALRIPGLLQTKFLDRVGGPQQVREGILDSLAHGTSVTAKISWLTGSAGQDRRGSMEGRPRWIHCTPMLGSDDKVGVWMIVMVESEEVTGSINARRNTSDAPGSALGAANPRFTENKLYTEYMRREGKDFSSPPGSPRNVPREISLPSRQGSDRRVGTEPEPFTHF